MALPLAVASIVLAPAAWPVTARLQLPEVSAYVLPTVTELTLTVTLTLGEAVPVTVNDVPLTVELAVGEVIAIVVAA